MITALITGATSGIGLATAELFLQSNIRVIACGRRKERLEQLISKFQGKNLATLNFDVRDSAAVFNSISKLDEEWKEIDILINNAGNAHGLAPIHEGNLQDWDDMIDINVKGLLYVSKAVIPGMVERKKGHIVNIGSIAGKETYANGNVYCASKFAVDALNRSMRLDLFSHGIRVSAINPGLVETEFSKVRFKGDTDRAKKVYEGYTPLTGQDIAEIIHFVVTRPHHVNLADVLVLPTDQAAATIVNKKN